MGLFSQQSTLLSLSQDLISFMDLLIGVLAPLALVIFFMGLVRYIYHGADSHAHAEARESILWSLIALFVLFSVWGILQLMLITFFPSADNSTGVNGYTAPGYNNSLPFGGMR